MVSGVAHLDGLIYIMCDRSTTLLVYDDATLQRKNDVLIQTRRFKKINIYDIAACKVYNSLFITDLKNSFIFKLTDGGRTVTKWLNRHSWVTTN